MIGGVILLVLVVCCWWLWVVVVPSFQPAFLGRKIIFNCLADWLAGWLRITATEYSPHVPQAHLCTPKHTSSTVHQHQQQPMEEAKIYGYDILLLLERGWMEGWMTVCYFMCKCVCRSVYLWGHIYYTGAHPVNHPLNRARRGNCMANKLIIHFLLFGDSVFSLAH